MEDRVLNRKTVGLICPQRKGMEKEPDMMCFETLGDAEIHFYKANNNAVILPYCESISLRNNTKIPARFYGFVTNLASCLLTK